MSSNQGKAWSLSPLSPFCCLARLISYNPNQDVHVGKYPISILDFIWVFRPLDRARGPGVNLKPDSYVLVSQVIQPIWLRGQMVRFEVCPSPYKQRDEVKKMATSRFGNLYKHGGSPK